MKKFLTLVCVSALGGAMTFGAYKQFFEDSSSNKVSENPESIRAIPVSLKEVPMLILQPPLKKQSIRWCMSKTQPSVKGTRVLKIYFSEDLNNAHRLEQAQVLLYRLMGISLPITM